MNKENIRKLTEEMIHLTERSNAIYEEVRGVNEDKDFYSEVKPFADHAHEVTKQWAEEMKQWMQTERFTYLFPQQIDQAADNLADVAVQCFFHKTSYKRFKSHIQSIQYTLQNVLTEIDKKIQTS